MIKFEDATPESLGSCVVAYMNTNGITPSNIFPTPAESWDYPISNILCWSWRTFHDCCAMDDAADLVRFVN